VVYPSTSTTAWQSIRSFLRHIVADAIQGIRCEYLPENLLAIGFSVRGSAIEITSDGDCGHSDEGSLRKLLF